MILREGKAADSRAVAASIAAAAAAAAAIAAAAAACYVGLHSSVSSAPMRQMLLQLRLLC